MIEGPTLSKVYRNDDLPDPILPTINIKFFSSKFNEKSFKNVSLLFHYNETFSKLSIYI